MSWLFSRALVEASSGAISSDGALYVPLSGTPTPRAFSLPVKTTDACPRFRSGMTCERLTADRGEAVLTWCLEASLVRTSAPPGRGRALTAPAPACGERWPASLAKYDPATSLWRTHQCSLLGGLDAYSETWPRWGTMRDGECWGHATPVRPTAETASGSWPTPCTRDWKGASTAQNADVSRWTNWLHARFSQGRKTTYPNPECSESVMGWPLGWTELKPLATDRFQQWCNSHGGV
jgi:hypothetical protein